MRLLRTYLRPYHRQLLLVVVLLTLQAIANLYLPNLNADIINNGVVKGDVPYIISVGAIMLVVTLLLAVFAIIAVYWGAKTAMAFGRDVRGAVFRKVLGFSQAETNQFGTASLITRNTNDVLQIQQVLLMGLNVMIIAPIMATGGIILAYREDAQLWWLLVLVIPTLGVFIGLMLRRALPLFRAVQVKLDRINQVMRETLAGIRVIRAFVRTDHEEQRFDVANRDLTATSLRVTRLFALMIPTVMAIFNLTTVAIMWFGSKQVADGTLLIGNLLAFLQYVMLILFSVLMAVLMFVMVPRAAASAERVQQVLDTQVALVDPAEPVALPVARGRIELRNVTFRYPGAEAAVLHDISLDIEPGQTTAIVGSTGSGKSTLINLLPRFYDASEGSVSIDGVDVREMRQEDVWQRIGLVPQRAFLFSGTVASNLRYGAPDATDEELWAALEVAQASSFVREMPEGLAAPITQGGMNVSGGQRQRLAIARAVVRHPSIYIFDDSFSALDFKTDAQLRAALREETRNASVLIVAQRVGTIMQADRIVVLDAGAVVGVGAHRELLESCQTYREIVFSQLSDAEVA